MLVFAGSRLASQARHVIDVRSLECSSSFFHPDRAGNNVQRKCRACHVIMLRSPSTAPATRGAVTNIPRLSSQQVKK